TAGQRGQGGEEVPGGKIHLHLRPDIAELVYGRHQPLETAVALDGHVQSSGVAPSESLQIPFRLADLRQHIVGQPQQPRAGWWDSADWVRCRRSEASTRLSASRRVTRVRR